MDTPVSTLRGPSGTTGIAVLVGYGLVLGVLLVLVYLVPYAVFRLL